MSTKLATTNKEFWNDRLDDLKKSRVTNDSGIAKMLDVSRQWVSKWRSGTEIPALKKLRILDLLTYDKTRDAFLGLMPDEVADQLRAADINRIHEKFGIKNDQED